MRAGTVDRADGMAVNRAERRGEGEGEGGGGKRRYWPFSALDMCEVTQPPHKEGASKNDR